MPDHRKHPRDPAELAKFIVDEATGTDPLPPVRRDHNGRGRSIQVV
jgi:hypothetical protein